MGSDGRGEWRVTGGESGGSWRDWGGGFRLHLDRIVPGADTDADVERLLADVEPGIGAQRSGASVAACVTAPYPKNSGAAVAGCVAEYAARWLTRRLRR